MKLEEQVCSLDLAKRLKELNVEQESLFGYTDYGSLIMLSGSEPQFFSAFTVAELGEMLPNFILTFKDDYGRWRCDEEEARGKRDALILADTEADARAKTLIYLLENKLITL